MKSLIEIPEKMKALVLHEVGRLTLDEVDVPKLVPGTVLLKVKACGICSSDVERVFINGTYHFPTIPGHEFAGQIVAVGDEVDETLLGKRACVFPMLPCFDCPSCKKQQYAQCSNYNYFGSRCDGAYAEYLVVPVWNLVLFGEELSYEVAAMCEPAAVGIHANGLANVRAGQTVLVIGTGIIGYVCAAFASQITDKVIMCGNSAAKLALAKEYGWQTVALETDNFEEKIAELTDGEGVDVVMEVVGTNQAICNAVAAAGPNSTIVLVGNPKTDLTMEKNLYWKILRKSITLRGSWNSSYSTEQNDWKAALEGLKGGKFDSLITHRFPLEKADEAFAVMRDRNTFSTKVMFIIE